MGIKPGPKPIAKSTGKEDKRQRVAPDTKPRHPTNKGHQISFDSADQLAEQVAALTEKRK